MKAAVIHQYGGPEELKYEDVPDPVPGAREVLIKVAAAGINPIDRRMALRDAAAGQAAVEKGGLHGKVLLIP